MPNDRPLVLSVVSHGQRDLVHQLLGDLEQHVRTRFRVILTENFAETPAFPASDYAFPIEVIQNPHRKGFGANHNSALERAGDGWFCVLNPDIRLSSDPFPPLLSVLDDPQVGVASPAITAPDGATEDHARAFPSIFSLAAKALGLRSHVVPPAGSELYYPDWVAGMFMLFRTDLLRSLGGFDERYFLYYEDVDLCARIRERGLEVVVCTLASAIHAARRDSRRRLRYAAWHLRSMARFLASRPSIALGMGIQR